MTLDTNSVSVNPSGCGSAPDAAVPEPSVWALLIAGFGLTGTRLRVRWRKIA